METKSNAYELMQFVWRNEETKSYVKLNSIMKDALNLAIEAKLIFEISDFSEIKKNFRGGYWFGVNANGKGQGEMFYSTAARTGNISACKSYEEFVGIKPFITTEGHRSYVGKMLRDNSRRYRVTGFDFEKKTMSIVSYDISDYREEGSKKLHSFNSSEWLIFRKNIREF